MGAATAGQQAGGTPDKLRHVESMSELPSGAGTISGISGVVLGESLADEEHDLVFPSPEFSGISGVVLGESLADEEHDLVFPSPEFSASALVSSPKQYKEMYERSIKDPAGFWSEIADAFYWKEKWNPSEVCSENLDVSKGPVHISWFKGGKTNICFNAVDRNVEAGNGDKIAMYWEGNEPGQDGKLTYSELLEKVCQLANYLKSVGVGKGDAVVIYLPMLLELPIAMLACARIGAVHSVVFADFSADSLAQRIVDCKPKLVLTCNAVKRGPKPILLKDIVDAALVESEKNGFSVGICLTYENQSVMKRQDTKWQTGRDVWWQDVVTNFPTKCDVEWVDAEDPLFLLYTSGSTGKPKGVMHTSGGYMVYTATTFKYAFDYKPTDIYWCTVDCGWITGHSYVTYGPLLNGAAVLVFEGTPNYPDAGRCWDIVDKYKVSIFYTAPTLVRSLMRDGDEYVTRYSRKSLRVLGSVGEPINPSAWRWFYNVVGDSKCPISDTWWQTETGGFMMTPLPGAWPQKPGSATFPFFGVQPVIVDEKGQEIEGECSGYLCIKKSWPGAFRTLYGDHDRYETTYYKPFAGYYFTGDGCSRDKDGYHWLTGRVDDVINVSGHRIGIAEVESALVSHPQCAEAAVVGVEHEVERSGQRPGRRPERRAASPRLSMVVLQPQLQQAETTYVDVEVTNREVKDPHKVKGKGKVKGLAPFASTHKYGVNAGPRPGRGSAGPAPHPSAHKTFRTPRAPRASDVKAGPRPGRDSAGPSWKAPHLSVRLGPTMLPPILSPIDLSSPPAATQESPPLPSPRSQEVCEVSKLIKELRLNNLQIKEKVGRMKENTQKVTTVASLKELIEKEMLNMFNFADAAELQKLEGIKDNIVKAISERREEKKFMKVEELWTSGIIKKNQCGEILSGLF